MVNREHAQSASGSPVRPQRPNFDPWLKQHADASEASHNESPNHRNHRNLRRLQRLDILHSDPIRPSSPSVQHSQPFSPRWDSRSAGASPISSNSRFPIPVSSTPQRTRAESSPTPRPPPRSAFPGLCSNPFIPEALVSPTPRSAVRQFPLLETHDEVQDPPVTSPTTAPYAERLFEMRQATPTEGHPPVVENFSRPRKPSVRSQNSEPPPSRHYHSSRLQPESAFDQQPSTHVYPNHNRAPSPWSRSRGLSTSSSQSTSTFSSLPHQPSNDQLRASSRSSVRRRDRTPTGTSHSRPPLTHANQTLTPSRDHQPWLATGDELRSSFRSQLTTSTAQGTLFTPSGTERSSVLTKTSSVTEQSIINGYAHTSWRQTTYEDDGLSLEDVMGMYERGFNDSDIESIRKSMRFADDDDDTQEIGQASGTMTFELSRPPSSRSDASAMRAKMLEAMTDQMPLPGALAIPEPSPASKRESRNSIRKSLLPSSLPKDMGLGFGEYMKRNRGVAQDQAKHDSAKLVDTDDDMQRPGTGSPSSPTVMAVPPSPVDAPFVAPVSRPVTPAPAAQMPVEPPEEPGCRDRYGFKKANTNVSRAEYDAWDASYSEYLARRRRKWVAYLKDNSLMTDRPNRFPARNAKTKRFIRKGIPPDWRGAAWFYYAGGPAILGKHRGVYDDLVRRAALDPVGPGNIPNRTSEVKTLVVEDIEKDLHRTFPDNVRFKPPRSATPPPQTPDHRQPSDEPMDEAAAKRASEPVIITSLRRVLHAFALYNPRIGYCQSLNFLAGLLLLFVDTEEQAFWLLNVITRVYLPGTHEMSLEGSKVDLGVLMLALKDSLPNVWKQIGGDEHEAGPTKRFRGRRGAKDNTNSGPAGSDPNRLPTITICMTAWFMSCFIGTLPIETVLRVWDVFFYEGSRTLFRIALTIFKLGESEIKAVADPMEMFGVVQSFPRKLIDCNAVMEACYRRRNGIGHLSQEVVEEKREERRAGIRKWRAEQEAAANAMAPVTAAAGLDLAADIDVNRKGTLFGKRKDKDREQARADEVM